MKAINHYIIIEDIKIENSTLSLKADLGGVVNSMWLLAALILGIGIILSIILTFVIPSEDSPIHPTLIVAMSLSPWPVLLPILVVMFKKITTRSIDALIHNMTNQ